MNIKLNSAGNLKALAALLLCGAVLAQPRAQSGPGNPPQNGPGMPPPQPGGANPDNPRFVQPRAAGEGNRGFRSPAGTKNWPLFREPGTSAPLTMFRQFMREEMKNIPTLEPRLTELVEIQQQRTLLQKQRAQIADDRSLNSEESLRKFHDLLKREDDLNNRQKGVLQALIKDAPQIQKQIGDRKSKIQERLHELGAEAPEPGEPQPADLPEQAEIRNLNHAAKLYDFLSGRITALQANPDRVELLNRFFKGLPNSDEPDGPSIEKARTRLDQLQQEHDNLSDRMERIESELRELRQYLRSNGAGAGGGQRWRNPNREGQPARPEMNGEDTTLTAPGALRRERP
jgi:hypothetical protein